MLCIITHLRTAGAPIVRSQQRKRAEHPQEILVVVMWVMMGERGGSEDGCVRVKVGRGCVRRVSGWVRAGVKEEGRATTRDSVVMW